MSEEFVPYHEYTTVIKKPLPGLGRLKCLQEFHLLVLSLLPPRLCSERLQDC